MHISYLDLLFKPIDMYNDDSESQMILSKACVKKGKSYPNYLICLKVLDSFVFKKKEVFGTSNNFRSLSLKTRIMQYIAYYTTCHKMIRLCFTV